MRTNIKWASLMGVVLSGIIILAACATPTPQVITETVQVTQLVRETEVVRETVEVPVEVQVTPTAETMDRTGAMVDKVIVVEEPSLESAVSRLSAGEFDVYAFAAADPEVLDTVDADPNLKTAKAFGTYDDLTFNVVGPTFEATGKLNPFYSQRIREAMNWLIDRNYIGQEIMGGLGIPRYLPVSNGFPDYVRYIDKVRELEARYAPDPERAKQVITEEMEAMGAEFVDGQWMYNGEQVEIIGLIRTEDERREIGDYVGNLLEDLGFAVIRDYKSSAEASPIWLRGDPNDGLFHYYTGGWVTTIVSRDQAANFDFFFTPRGRPELLWQAYSPSPEFDDVSDRLARNAFSSLEERGELFRQALEYSIEDSDRLFLVDEASYSPYRVETNLAFDLAGGIQGAWLWPYTLQKEGQVGGTVTLANASILTDPWNPIAGSNWVYDTMLQRGTGELQAFPDPFTGLVWPQRLDHAEVFNLEGLPVTSTLDWVDLQFVPEIDVPEDAWIDWDATEQRFITVGEQNPDGLTAVTKVVAYYPDDLYSLQWHDGSNFSLADLVMGWIMIFDIGKEDSPLFDESQVPGLVSFQDSFRGFRIVQEDPLIVEYYSDQFFLDAETNLDANNLAASQTFFPYYVQGPGAWHNLALGVLAETDGELAFSSSKANANEVEWMSYIGGPSLDILGQKLEQAASEGYIPFAPTLSQYITPDEAAARYQNLEEWNRKHENYWVGTGAFYIDRVFPVEGTVILSRNPNFPDPAQKWARFGEPRFPAGELDGPGRVAPGEEAQYDVTVDFEGEPYPVDDIQQVKYLVFDATGALVLSGDATAIEDGHWQITLSPEETQALEAGANRLEVAVVSRLVSIPTFLRFEFVTAP